MQKKPKKNSRSAKTRGFGVILESVESSVQQIAEGHAVLDQKIDNLAKEVDDGFRMVDTRFKIVDDRFKEVSLEFKGITDEFKGVDYKFERVFEELHLIRNDLKEKVSRDEFVVLEKRVMEIEKKLSHQK